MKTNFVLNLVVGVLVALVSVYAWSQTSEPGVASPALAVPAPSSMTDKESRQANRALRRKVYGAIVNHKDINAGNISVVAKGGAVTLNGTVTDASQIDTVAKIVRNVAGVTSVTNKLTVVKPFGGQ
jgi:hyperosmotically inducible periplasmic protein